MKGVLALGNPGTRTGPEVAIASYGDLPRAWEPPNPLSTVATPLRMAGTANQFLRSRVKSALPIQLTILDLGVPDRSSCSERLGTQPALLAHVITSQVAMGTRAAS